MPPPVVSPVARFLNALGLDAVLSQGALASYLLPGLGAAMAVVCMLAVTPLVIQGARRWGWVAHPQADRWHTRPVALMGGIAIFVSTAVAASLTGVLDSLAWPVWVGGILVFAAGLADDLYDIRPDAKLVVQVVSTILLLYAGYAFWRGGPFWVSIPLTFLWVIGIINAVNLIDGMDGLAAGIASVGAFVLGMVAWLVGDVALATLAAVLGGAAAGFLFFNFKPAKIFMGDCGSMFLGYVLATIAMSVQGRGGPFAATLAPVVVLAVPIFDTAFVTVTRILSGRPVTQGGNDHTMHRLVRLGLSERHTVLTLYGVSLVFGLAALAVYGSSAQLFYALVLLAVVASVVFALYLANTRAYGGDSDDLRMRQPLSSTQRFGAVMRAVAGGVFWKSVGGVVADVLLVGATFVAAYHLRFEGSPPPSHQSVMLQALPALMGLKVGVFYLFRMYHGIWRHAGTPEVVRIAGASSTASLLVFVGLLIMYPMSQISVSVIIIDWMLATAAVGGVRFGFRALRQYFASHRQYGRRAVIVGTDAKSLLALRHLRQDLSEPRTAIGFLTPDGNRSGMRVQGLSVLGSVADLAEVCRQHDVDEVILPTAEFDPGVRRRISMLCHEADVSCQLFSLSLRPAPVSQLPASPEQGDGSTHEAELPDRVSRDS